MLRHMASAAARPVRSALRPLHILELGNDLGANGPGMQLDRGALRMRTASAEAPVNGRRHRMRVGP